MGIIATGMSRQTCKSRHVKKPQRHVVLHDKQTDDCTRQIKKQEQEARGRGAALLGNDPSLLGELSRVAMENISPVAAHFVLFM